MPTGIPITASDQQERDEIFSRVYKETGRTAFSAVQAGCPKSTAGRQGKEMRNRLFPGHGRNAQADSNKSSAPADQGLFYILDLIPEADINRLKFGFTSNVVNRLKQHQTTAPTAKVIRTWPCKRVWEVAAMDVIGRGESQVGHERSEVFDVYSVEEVIHRGDQFFSMMPCLLNDSSS